MSNQLTFEFKWRSHDDGEWHTQCSVSSKGQLVSDRIFILLSYAYLDDDEEWIIEIFDNTVKGNTVVDRKKLPITFKKAKRLAQKMAIRYWAISNMERLLAKATREGDLE